MTCRSHPEFALAVVLLAAGPAAGHPGVPNYDFQWVTIGDVGNPAFTGGPPKNPVIGRGSVGYEYRISRLQITSGQWLEFINTFAPQSPNPYFFLAPINSGITQSLDGPPGTWELRQGVENAAMVPVQGITWRDAAMYCNWLHNGKSSDWSAIMDGAYDASTFTNNPNGPGFSDQLTRSPGAKFWIPSLDEWVKAVHYDPNHGGPGVGGWWLYPNSSDNPLVPGPPGTGDTSAGSFDYHIPSYYIPLGSYPHAQSPWGLMDVSGGAREWMEEPLLTPQGVVIDRGLNSSWAGESFLDLDLLYTYDHYSPNSHTGGLRVASSVPGPSGTLLIAFAGMLFSIRRRHQPRQRRAYANAKIAAGPQSAARQKATAR
jgi:hypothetical protein